MKKNKTRRWIIILIIALLAFVSFRFLTRQNTAVQNQYNLHTVSRGNIERVSLASGKMEAAELSIQKLSGSDFSFNVKVGDSVEKDQELGQYTRIASTIAVYAPASGVLNRNTLNNLVIQTQTDFEMEVQVEEGYYKGLSTNQSAEVYVNATDTTYTAKITSIKAFNPVSKTVSVTLQFSAPDSALRSGMSSISKMPVEGYGDYYFHGSIQSSREIDLAVDGVLSKLYADVGETVTKGQKLAEYKNSSQSDVTIKAAQSGIITALPSVSSNDLSISSGNQFKLIVNVTENDIGKIELNQAAEVYVEALNQTFNAKVSHIAYVGNTAQDFTSYPVTVDLTESSDAIFIGMSASARIVTETRQDIPLVPYEALVMDEKQAYLISSEWLKNANAPVENYYLPVEIGLADAFHIEILNQDSVGQEILIPRPSSGFDFGGPF